MVLNSGKFLNSMFVCAVLLAAEPQVMQQLVTGGASVNHRDQDGLSCLAAAVFEGDRRAVALLCTAGADVNAPADGQGNSALEIAAFDEVSTKSHFNIFIKSFWFILLYNLME